MAAELTARIDTHLRRLRQADSQAAAIEWMTMAYRLMEESIEALNEKPAPSTIERLVFVPAPPIIEVVQPADVLPIIHRATHTLVKRSPWREAALIRYDAPQLPPSKALPPAEPLTLDGVRRNASIMRGLKLIQKKGR